MKILITDIDDTLLDWTKSFDIFARKHFDYNGIALSKNPQRLWDALNTTKENIPEFMKAHNESSEFAQLEYLNDSEILNNAFDKFDKIIGLTSCGDTPIVKTLRQNNLNKLFPELTEVIYLPFLAQKDEVLKEEQQVEKEPEPVYQSLQGEETVAVKEVVQEIVDLKSLDSYNFDYETKAELDEKIKKTQTTISDSVYKLSLLKDKTKQGPFMNESYLDCPSYKKMIPQIQNVIVEKRKMSINKFWYEKYRPELVEEIVFPNEVIKETIHDYVDNRYIKGHCMFFGQGGVGKTTTNIVLMNAVLESVKDRFVLERKVQDIEDLKGWLRASPIGKQKIVIAEEFDRLSDAAQTEIKNGLMEKYDNVVFLASTNKLHKIDSALLSRFTLVAKFDVAPVEELAKKCATILSNERISYKMSDVIKFAENNKLKGLRTIINNLQLSCYNNIFDADRTSFFIGNSGAEFDILQNIKWYINAIVNLDKNSLFQLSYNLNVIPDIAKVRQNITFILQSNYSLNLEYVYTELLNEQIYLPIKNLVTDYYQDSELKKLPTMHFEAMLNDIIMETLKSKDIFGG